MSWELLEGDCVERMAAMAPASVDAVVCDPPYGLGFMGKQWDAPGRSFVERRAETRNRFDHVGGNHNPSNAADAARTARAENRRAQEWHEAWAREALRVLKPGGHLLAFGGTRTYHRLVCAVEDAGFEVRDTICWLYGSGFPKSLNLNGGWQGWGTALKPAHEPILVARKPLDGTVAGNVLAHGTGALNVDGCRVEGGERPVMVRTDTKVAPTAMAGESTGATSSGEMTSAGRWPANVVLDEQAAGMLDEQTGITTDRPAKSALTGEGSGSGVGARHGIYQDGHGGIAMTGYQTSGGASRFFYVAKASSAERNAGLDGFEERTADPYGQHRGRRMDGNDARFDGKPAKVGRNVHPTVKPVDLMRWLVRLVTPPDGLILDPFAGSGTTGCAAILEGARFIGIERDAEYVSIARARIGWWAAHPDGMTLVHRLEAETTRKAVAESGQLGLFGSPVAELTEEVA